MSLDPQRNDQVMATPGLEPQDLKLKVLLGVHIGLSRSYRAIWANTGAMWAYMGLSGSCMGLYEVVKEGVM